MGPKSQYMHVMPGNVMSVLLNYTLYTIHYAVCVYTIYIYTVTII